MITGALRRKLDCVKEILGRYPGVVIALSGGVDSSLLSAISRQTLGKRAIAVTACSAIQSREELKRAAMIASRTRIKHIIVKTRVLTNPSFTANPLNRCYVCKKMLMHPMLKIARESGYQIIEASNLDDLSDYRPGRRAVKEMKIASPFVEAKLTKNEIRRLARYYRLPNWNQPSNACYASRIPYNQKISLKKLKRIAAAEDYLRALGLGQVRVRDHDPTARIELNDEFMPALMAKRRSITTFFKKIGYQYVTLDLEEYRTGSLNPEKNRTR